jgi:hypothetical protein
VSELHWQAGDNVMFFYWSSRNGGPEYCRGEVLAVNGEQAEVQFPAFRGIIRRRTGDLYWDSNSHERCRLVSHWDGSGGPTLALVCPRCGHQLPHTCRLSHIRHITVGKLATVWL